MKIALVRPPSEDFLYEKIYGLTVPPLGMAYIAAFLEQHGYKVKVIDMPTVKMDWNQYQDEILKLKPDLVGIYCAATRTKQAMKAAEIAKGTGSTVMIGGPQATLEYELLLKANPQVDIAVRGEGEFTSLELVETLENNGDLKNVRGIAFRKEDKVLTTPPRELVKNLDELPFPAWHLFPVSKYRIFHEASLLGMSTSRGCPYNCKFCAVPAIYNHTWRGRSPANVVDEMEQIREKYHPHLVVFLDDYFTLDLRRVEGICDEILKRKLDVLWGSLSTGTDIPYKLMRKMQRAGCFILIFGVEFGSQEMLSKVGRERTLESTVRAFRYARRAGIVTLANVVLGFPRETRRSMRETLEFVKKLEADQAMFFKAVPYSEFSFEELDRIEREAYKGFYLRKSYILKHIARGFTYQIFVRHLRYDLLALYGRWLFRALDYIKNL